jgi:hypothetical protein
VQAKDDTGADAKPGDTSGTVFRGYTEEAVLVTFAFHDLGPYKTMWSIDSTTDLGSGLPYYFDDTDGGAGPPHPDTFIIVDGVGTLHPSGFTGGGTFHPEWNAWLT